MFTKSNNNAYNFPISPRSSAAALVGLHANDLLHHHHHDMLAAAHHFASANHDLSALGGGGEPAKAAAAKKDRHSKIDTAQGPRDRRVRLSIGVARKFFDLQENLGFDKPSKTLDWLLTNSKTAIKDLEEMREAAAAAAATGGGGGESEVDSGEKSGGGSSAGKMKAAARESRAKARARARERTREKMCIKKLNETRNVVCSSNGDFNSIQFMNNQLEFRKIAASSSNINLGFHSYEAAAANHEDLIQESIVIKRKVKNPMGFQQNLIISSSNYGVPPPYNAAAAENWDNICAILDQHKFINSASNN